MVFSDTAIEYRIADLEELELPEASFDFAFSARTVHYSDDFKRLVRMVHRTLAPGSHFVFTIEHPDWSMDEHGRKPRH